MDVDADISQYLSVIDGQKQLLQKARSRQGQRPRDRKPREQMYMEFMMAHMAVGQCQQGHMIHSSFIPPAYLPCTTPIAQLTPILIRQLTLETHHQGRYLLLRAITPPNRMTAIIVLAADRTEDVAVLQLYQHEDEDARPATDVVDVGTMLLVKEPYFKVMASGDYGLRVDHLSDIVHIEEGHPVLPKEWITHQPESEESAEGLKSKGDSAIGAGKYWEAIKHYSKAIAQGPAADRITVIQRNRSLAYLKTKQYDNALSDTGFPDFGATPAEKALFRAAEALYSLQRFDECIGVLETLLSTFPNNKQARDIYDRVGSRHVEARSGVYDFGLLHKEAHKLQPPQLDYATYIGPIEIKASKGKGRGVFTTKAVKAGDMLLCEKAFGHVYVSQEDTKSSKQSLLINTGTGRGFMGGQADLLKLLVQKTYRNPSVARAVTELYHGDYEPASTLEVDGQPVVDTFLFEKIMALNVFGCPLSSLETHKATRAQTSKPATAYHSCGMWIQASYINHSCTSNARRSFIGDMMIVRATRDLEAGEELSFWYHVPTGEPGKAQKKLANWGFACSCALCADEKATKAAVHGERTKLLNQLGKIFQPSSAQAVNVPNAERLLSALNSTYTRPTLEVPRLRVWDVQAVMTQVYMAQGKVDKALESSQRVLVLLGFTVMGVDATSTPFRILKWGFVVDHLIEAFLQARTAFEAVGLSGDSRAAEAYARTVYKMVVGEDASFEATYGE
ncbi:TPR domain-containing protein [Stagonosporopsis vannaccii]|nr:TPR domain-containing protein [Stagonosporopsis vannaccii]